jgi:hypothetical protein
VYNNFPFLFLIYTRNEYVLPAETCFGEYFIANAIGNRIALPLPSPIVFAGALATDVSTSSVIKIPSDSTGIRAPLGNTARPRTVNFCSSFERRAAS